MSHTPKILNIQQLTQSRLFTVEAVDLEFSNGVRAQYERVKGSKRGGVLIVPMLDRETVILIREYCVGTERYELALPKGRLEGDEEIEYAANRELQEEIGYAARQLTKLTQFTLAPGYFSHITHVVLAQDLYPQKALGDEPEPIEIVPYPLDEIQSLIQKNELSEARSIAALYLVKERLQNE